jgi:hypothetical protein
VEIRHSWPSTSWFPLTRAISSFMQFLCGRSCFLINGNLYQIHEICYKCLTWNIYNFYIKYTFLGLIISLLLDLISRFSIESVIHGRWTICLAWHSLWQCLCSWEEVNPTPHLSQFYLSSSSPSRWGIHESYHGCQTTFKQMFSCNSIEKELVHWLLLHNSDLRCKERLKFNNHQIWVGVWRTLPQFRFHGMKHSALDLYGIVTAITIITIIILDHEIPQCVS